MDDAELQMNNCVLRNNRADINSRAEALSLISENNRLDNVEIRATTLNDNSVWPDIDPTGFTYIILGDQTIPAGLALTINPGTDLRINDRGTELLNDGQLNAIGTSAEKIKIFGGNLNGGGSVVCRNGSTAQFEYCTFDTLGVEILSAFDCALYIDSADVFLDNCQFINNTQADIRGLARDFSLMTENNRLDKVKIRSGDLDENATLPNLDPVTGFTYQMEADLTVEAGITLTMNPGTEIELAQRAYDLLIDGTLLAEGSSDKRIRFYSNSVSGGGSVVMRNGSDGSFEYCDFENLGTDILSAFDCSIYIDSAQVSLSQSHFDGSSVKDIRGRARDFSLFEANNDVNSIQLINSTLAEAATWPKADSTGVVYVLNSDLTVENSGFLTLDAGITVDNPVRSYDMFIDGGLLANANVFDTIHFISSGSEGGGSLVIESSFVPSLKYCSFDSWGTSIFSAFDCGVRLKSNANLFACHFEDLASGIIVEDMVDPSIKGCTFTDNDHGIQFQGLSIPEISLCSFEGNSVAISSDVDTITACSNWWGDVSGPYNALNNPTGLGDTISDLVVAPALCAAPVNPDVFCVTPFNTGFDYNAPQLLLEWEEIPGAFGYKVEASRGTDSAVFLSSLPRRIIPGGLNPGDTVLWKVKAACAFDTSALSPEDSAFVPLLKLAELHSDDKVWPNPAVDMIHIQIDAPASGYLEFFDLQGRRINNPIQLDAGKNQLQVEVANWPDGIYIYQWKKGSEQSSGRIVVSKDL
jgi:hypothetical protein